MVHYYDVKRLGGTSRDIRERKMCRKMVRGENAKIKQTERVENCESEHRTHKYNYALNHYNYAVLWIHLWRIKIHPIWNGYLYGHISSAEKYYEPFTHACIHTQNCLLGYIAKQQPQVQYKNYKILYAVSDHSFLSFFEVEFNLPNNCWCEIWGDETLLTWSSSGKVLSITIP